MNLAYALERFAYIKTDETAVKFRGKTYTYGEINSKTNRYANLLKQFGVQTGERVSLWLPNGLDFICGFYAILKIGALAVPMNFLFKEAEAQYILADSEAKVLITAKEKLGMVDALLPGLPNLEKVLLVDEREASGERLVGLPALFERVLEKPRGHFKSGD
jgi:acyl-CoA synthetase (AMP-forming)/AMP-acid ligase II